MGRFALTLGLLAVSSAFAGEGSERVLQLDAMRKLKRESRGVFLEVLASREASKSALAADALGVTDIPWMTTEGLADARPRVRAQCAACLGRLRHRPAASEIAALLDADKDPEVLEMAARALSRIGGKAQIPMLRETAQSSWKDVRMAARLALIWLEHHAAETGPAEGGGGPAPRGSVASYERESQEVVYGRPKRRCEWSRTVLAFDCSGSIPDPARQQAVYAQEVMALAPETMFDVVAFGGGVVAWKGELVPATPENLRDAARWIRAFDSASGVTPLASAVRKVIRGYDVDEAVLYTDGGGNSGVSGEDLFDYLQIQNVCRRVRLKGVPVGNLHVRYNGGGTTGQALARLVEESFGTMAPRLASAP